MSDIVVQFRGTVYEAGYGQVAQKVMRDRSIHAVAKAMYAYLVSFAGKDGNAFPGVQLMMADLGIKTKDTYYKYRDQLEAAGYITIEQQRTDDGRFFRNVYNIEAVPIPHVQQPSTKISDTELPSPKKSNTVKSTSEKSTTINQDINNISLNKNSNNNINHTINEIDPVCVENIKSQYETNFNTPVSEKVIKEWLKEHDEAYILSKIFIVKQQGSSNPLRSLRAAIKHNWESDTQPQSKTTTIVPTAQEGKYERFYKVYGKQN